MANDDVFDVIVIGTGPVGLTAAARAVRGGLSACVIERRLVGGECNYYGCIPSKALLWPMEHAGGAGPPRRFRGALPGWRRGGLAREVPGDLRPRPGTLGRPAEN